MEETDGWLLMETVPISNFIDPLKEKIKQLEERIEELEKLILHIF